MGFLNQSLHYVGSLLKIREYKVEKHGFPSTNYRVGEKNPICRVLPNIFQTLVSCTNCFLGMIPFQWFK